MKKRSVAWLLPEEYKGDYQFYRQWATEAWIRTGNKVKRGNSLPFNRKKILGQTNALARLVPDCLKKDEALIVCCGAFPNYAAWPYMYSREIIPIVWDCWPEYHARLLKSIKDCKIKTIFCTSSQTCAIIRNACPQVNPFWLPEGIDVEVYGGGRKLVEREIDVLELGRQFAPLHESLVRDNEHSDEINHLYSKGGQLLFEDFASLTSGLSNSKIVICYPRCDTHPEIAGNIETLTQRYWECMLSGALIVGRAPRELIDFCGYNPVIELKNDYYAQIKDILGKIDSYQLLCDKNRDFALKNASWDSRMSMLISRLRDCGYEI